MSSLRVTSLKGRISGASPTLPDGAVVTGILTAPSSGITFTQTGTGATTTTVDSKLKDVVSVKDFGAVGDGVADDTTAIAAAITASKVVTFPAGVYNTDSILIKDTRSRSLIAEGSFDPVQQPVVLRPRTDQTAVGTFFEIGSSAYIKIQGIAFNCANKVNDTLVHLRANSDESGSAAGTLRIKFEECSFLVGDDSTLQPAKTVRLSNTGQIDFVRCFFEGGNSVQAGYGVSSSVAVELGITTTSNTNPGAGSTPLGGGETSQTVFDCCYFKGDVVRINADHTSWFNCNFYGKPHETQNPVSRVLAVGISTLTAMEKIDNCYLDTFNTTTYLGSWYNQSTNPNSAGGVEVSNSLLAGYNSLIEIATGNCKIFANRFLSLGSSGGRRGVYLEATAGAKAEIFGNDTTQIASSNSVASIPVRFVEDDRSNDTYDHYQALGSDHTVTTSATNVFTYSYKSIGTYITVRAQLALKHSSSSARRYEFKVQWDGSTIAPKRAITLVTLNEIHTHFIEQTFYLAATGEAKTLAISVTTTADTGLILQDDSWWAVEKVYN